VLNEVLRKDSTMPLPGLPASEVFVAVARHRSFRKAALARGVSTSAVSHAVRGLEQSLGVRLFNRSSRSIRITEAGGELLARIGPALGEIAGAVADIGASQARPAGTLRLNVPRNAADIVIQPIMAQFLAAYPDVRLEVVTQDGFVDIVAEGFDAGIRAGQDLNQAMVSVPLGLPLRFAVVGSPEYFTRREKPLVPESLLAHACIERRFPSGAPYPWSFARDGEAFNVPVSGRLVLDDRAMILAAALKGVGLAHLYETVVAEHVARGELVRVLEDWCPVLSPFHLYYPGRRQVPAPLRAFIDMAGKKSLQEK
jgi:DNA-binding transcriptional LysR family regulator